MFLQKKKPLRSHSNQLFYISSLRKKNVCFFKRKILGYNFNFFQQIAKMNQIFILIYMFNPKCTVYFDFEWILEKWKTKKAKDKFLGNNSLLVIPLI